MNRLANRGMPSYTQIPISERYGVSYTGYGNDGKLQKSSPAGTDAAGATYHEGEIKATTPEGSAYISADMAQLAGMTPKGFQSGGFSPSIPEIKTTDIKTMALPTPTPVTPPTPPTPPTPATETSARTQGLNYLQGTLTGTTGTQLAGQKATEDLRLRQAQERSAVTQKATQAGLDAGRSQLEGQMLRAGQETEANKLAGQYGVAAAQEKVNVASNLASQGLAGQQFEQQKTEYNKNENWKAYEAAIAAGDFNTAATTYKTMTGNDISMDQMKTYQNYLNTKQGQELTSGELSIDAQKLGLSNDKMNAIIKDINNGVPLATINSNYGTTLTDADYAGIGEKYRQSVQTGNLTLDQLKAQIGDSQYASIQNRITTGATLDQINKDLGTSLTKDQYNSMLEASALGERDWSRRLTAANMLLATEGANNKTAAAKAYSELFPGTSFDFSSVVTDENNASFSTGMKEMSNYILADMKPEDALLALEKSGALTKMGLTKDQATQIYKGMQINAIDAEWEEVETSDFYSNLSDNDKASIKEFYRQSITGELDYDVLKEYEIIGKDGVKVTTVYGKDSTEADKYAAANGYTVKDTGKVKFQMASTLTTPEDSVKTDTDLYNDFVKDVPGGTTVSYEEWKAAGGSTIKKYSDYTTAYESNPLIKLAGLTYESSSELLSAKNSKILSDAWAKDPSKIKDSKYYYEAPDTKTLIDNSEYDVGAGGKRTTTLDDKVKAEIKSNIGKVVEVKDARYQKAYTGQLLGVEETPATIEYRIRMFDGTEKTVTMVQNG